jgi:alanine-synthesizing transaminase
MFSRRTDWDLASNRLTLAHQEALRSGHKILDLTISNPTRIGIDYNESVILDALKNSKALDYDPQPKGLRSARESVAEYYSCGSVRPDPENIILTTGTSEGYSFIFRLLCNSGDEILVPKPSYPLFDFLADLEDVRLVPYALIYDHGWQIDFHSLQQACNEKSRAIVLVNPNNPTSSFISAQEKTQLNAFCAEHDLALIVDEVFLDYALDSTQKSSFVTNADVLTFTLSGVSKVSALPQMKLAWIVASGPGAKVNAALQRLELIADTYLSMNAPVQFAAPVLLEQRRSIQPQLMQRIRVNLAELDRQLAGQRSCSRLEIQGGWYAVLRIPATRSDEDFAIELLRSHSVFVHPGHFYDFSNDGYLVLSLIVPEREFCEGVSKLVRFTGEL